jgi:hypothetical protein
VIADGHRVIADGHWVIEKTVIEKTVIAKTGRRNGRSEVHDPPPARRLRRPAG